MAYSTIDKSSLYQNSVNYTGNNTGQSITGVGFQPDMVWNKSRVNTEAHNLWDIIRGTTKGLVPNDSGGESTWATGLTSFDSDGWTMGSLDSMNDGSIDYIAWCWKAGGAGSANTVGSIDSTVSVNTTSGFSIVQYVGDGAASATIGHGLGAKPKMFVVKSLVSDDWTVYNESVGAEYGMFWNNTDAKTDNDEYFYDTEPTSTVFSIGTNGRVNDIGVTYMAYCFSEISGYSKFGSYKGNGNADGAFIYTGFKPTFAICKQTNSANDWRLITDIVNTRNTNSNEVNKNLYIQSTAAESGTGVDFVSNGIKIKSTSTGINGNGDSYTYIAFGQPLISNSGVCATAR